MSSDLLARASNEELEDAHQWMATAGGHRFKLAAEALLIVRQLRESGAAERLFDASVTMPYADAALLRRLLPEEPPRG